MARPAGRDEKLLRTLYDEHGGPLLAYVERLVRGDRQQAEDIVQETLVRAWRNAERLAGDTARPWLFAVARNIAIDRARARRVILEVYYRGHSVAEAAATLGVPRGTVQSRTFYALRALRVALEERGVTAP